MNKMQRRLLSALLALLMVLVLLPLGAAPAYADGSGTEEDSDLLTTGAAEQSDGTEAEPVETEPEGEPVETEPEAEPVETEPEAEPVETEPEGEPVETEPIELEPISIEPEPAADPAAVNEPAALRGSGTEADPYIVTADTTEFTDGGYYLVESDVTNANRINVNGTAVLILGEGATLTAQKGIHLTGGKSLTIRGSGELIATADANFAGIGGSDATNCGDLTIEGGTITATGGQYAAGIGGGVRSSLRGTVTIKGGTVTATGGQYAAGIGGGGNPNWAGAYASCDNVVITGGTVIAIGSTNAAGIGGGAGGFSNIAADAGNCGSVTITGGVVTATGGSYGIGPGRNTRSSGHDGSAGTITLGWTKGTDSITASSYKGTVTVVEGHVLTDGENEYSGTLTDEQLSAIAGKTLIPGTLLDGFYLIGPDWTLGAINAENKFEANPDTAGEYMLETTLSAGDQIKVVKVASDAIAAWYPDGLDNQYTVDAAHAGEKTIYFRETYHNDWAAFGGYFWIEATQSYSVIVANNIENGTVVSDKASAAAGETVTLTVTPRSSYRLKTLTVLCGETAVATTAGENNTYTFTMPDGDVSVSAVFEWSTASADHTIFTEYIFENGSAGYNNEGPENLIDGDTNTKWCASIGSGLTITFHTDLPILPVGYILTTANDSANNSGARNPKDWTIEGRLSEDDEWTTLVAVTGDSTLPAANFTDAEFVLSTLKTCQYFRVTFSKVRSDSTFQLSEFKFFGEYDAVIRITQCAPTCVSMGYKRDCWYSYADDTYYADEDCTQPLNREDVEIPATGIHTLEEHAAVEPVGNTPGNIHYWHCTVCHKFFSDGEATNEITENDTIVYGAINYLDETGTLTQTTGAFSVVTSDVMEWTAGWWIVPETMTIQGRVNVNGDVHLILFDNTTLTVTNGIGVNTSANSLTIYSQSLGENMGALSAGPAQSYYAGIGGTKGGNNSYNAGNGPITINGGKIYAKGGWGAAGIGGGHNGAGFGLVTVNNGDIDAWGGDVGPGIGVGYGPSWYLERAKIVINGGTVVAHAGSHSAAIGGGEDANAEYITINGGNITAYGGEGSAAIGGGYVLNSNHGHGGNITINGGTVNAIAGANGAGIGDATNLKDHSLTTNIVLNWTSETDSITSSSYTYDNLTFEKDFIISGAVPAELATAANIAGKTIVPYEGKNVTVTFVYEQGGTDVFHEVTTVEGGAVQDPGTPMKFDSLFDGWYYLNGGNVVPFVCGTTAVSENTTVFAQWTSTAGQTVTYLDAEGSACSIDSGYTVLNAGIPAVTLTAGWYVAAHDVTFGERITVSGDVHLIVANDVTMTAQGGIQVGEGNSLTIYQNAGQAEGEAVGKLVCSATAYAAGIGGNGSDVKHSGVITINGCTINSSGGNYAAGIGGGNQGAGTVVINRGTVNAYGSSYASAIGGGSEGAGNVTINDGTIVARANRGAAIGGGSEGFGTVVINGGVIDAQATTSPGIGSGELAGTNVTINGGTVTAVGDYWAAGIGTCYNHKDVTVDITINGGTVTATGGRFGAGIGGGATTNVSSITITGGVVVANGGQYAAAIGGGGADLDQGQTGEKGNCGTLVITGGQVTANAGQYGVGIGNGGTCTTSGTITLGWTDKTDFIKATNYKGPVSVVDGKVLTDGTNDYYGTLTSEQLSAAAGKTLTPGMDSLNSVTIDDGIEHGTVTTDKKYAKEGDTVTLTVTPAEGYLLKSLSVMSGETEVATTGENGVYTFTMPDGDVTVTAEFEPDWDHIPDAGFTLSPAEVTLETFDADGYAAVAIAADTLTLGKIGADGQYRMAENLFVTYSAGTLACGDNVIPFRVYSDVHEGTGESHTCRYGSEGESGNIAILIDPTALADAGSGVYTGTMHYTSCWNGDAGLAASSGDIALTLTVVKRYVVNIDENIENGTVTADKATASDGETVTLSWSAESPYGLDTITVTAGDDEIELTQDGSRYTFVMPASDVTVSATFVKKYQVYVGETQITEKNSADVLGDGSVSFDPETGTLTVLSTDGFDPAYSGALINTYVDLVIESPNGPLTLTKSTTGTAVTAYGANLTVNGDVVLNVPNGGGFYVTSTLTITGNLSGTVANDGATGINGLTVKAVDLKKTSSGSYGLCSYNGTVAVEGNCTITGSAEYAVYSIYGFRCTGDVLLTGENASGVFSPVGDVKIDGNLTIDVSGYGISFGDYSSSTSYLISVGGNATITSHNSSGIYAGSASMTVGGDLTVNAYNTCVQTIPGLSVTGNAYVVSEHGNAINTYGGPCSVGGKLTAIAEDSTALNTYAGLTVGGDAQITACNTAINCYNASTVIGGKLTAVSEDSTALNTYGGLTVGGDTFVKACYSGIMSYSGSVVIDGNLTLEAGSTGIEVHSTGNKIEINGNANITIGDSMGLRSPEGGTNTRAYSIYALYCTETGAITVKGDLTVEGGQIYSVYGMHVTGDTEVTNWGGDAIFAPSGKVLLDGDVEINADDTAISTYETVIGGDAWILSYSDEEAIGLMDANGIENPLTVKGDLTVIAPYAERAVYVENDVMIKGDVQILSGGDGMISEGEISIDGSAEIVLFGSFPVIEDTRAASYVPTGISCDGDVTVGGNFTIRGMNPDENFLSGPIAASVRSINETRTLWEQLQDEDEDTPPINGVSSDGAVLVRGDVDIRLGTGDDDDQFAIRCEGSLILLKDVTVSMYGGYETTLIGSSSDITVGGVLSVSMSGEDSCAVYSEGDVTVGKDVMINAEGECNGIVADGTITVVQGDWDITAMWPLAAKGGIEIPYSHAITLPENGEVAVMGAFDSDTDYFGVVDPEDDSVRVYRVVITQTVPDFTGTIEWNSEDVKFKGTTAYVIANGSAHTPRFTVKDENGNVIDPSNYDYEYKENTAAGTGYLFVTFKSMYAGTARAVFKIYLPATTTTTVENVQNGIKLTWSPVEGADGYVIYRRAWNLIDDGWTDFVRWNNTTALEWVDTTVYAGTRYQYGIKAYFNKRLDPVSGTYIGGNVGDNFNLGEVGPLKTTVRITTRTLNSVTPGNLQMTVAWTGSSVFTGYQVKYATDANFTKNVKAIKIANAKTYSTVITGLTAGTTYYVTVRSYHEFNGMTYFGQWSNVLSAKAGAAPKITTQPTAKTVASGSTATFKVVASGSGLTYQWYYSKNNGSTWTSWSGKTSATLSVKGSETNNGYLYRCVVTNTYGSATSSSAKLMVTGVKPKITAQPANQTVASGSTATFKVVAAGENLTYQWYYSKNNGSTWTKWSGKTGATLSFKGSATNNGYLYRCVVTNSYGSVTSSSAKLTVTGN